MKLELIPAMTDSFTFDATDGTCAVCGQRVSGGRCFCHLRYKDGIIALCCPLCLEIFQNNPDRYDIIREISKALKPDNMPGGRA